jgi:hypothetical protein
MKWGIFKLIKLLLDLYLIRDKVIKFRFLLKIITFLRVLKEVGELNYMKLN